MQLIIERDLMLLRLLTVDDYNVDKRFCEGGGGEENGELLVELHSGSVDFSQSHDLNQTVLKKC